MIESNNSNTIICQKKPVYIEFVESQFKNYKNKQLTHLSVRCQIRSVPPTIFSKLNNIFQPQEIYFYKNFGVCFGQK